MEKDEIVITKKQIELTTKKAGTFAMTSAGEKYILALDYWKNLLEEKLEEAKAQIAQDAIKNGDDNVLGETIRVAVRKTGKKYDGFNQKFMKKVSYDRIDEVAIDELKKQGKSLPEGIVEVPQKISASIYVKKNKK
jgi:hypothetical protein